MVATKLDFERFALDHTGQPWELHRGQVREKPPMASGHGLALQALSYQLFKQLDESEYIVRTGYGHVARASVSYYIPDVFVVPAEDQRPMKAQPRSFEVYRNPLPLIVEIWSPSTGTYDIAEKLPEYMERGDLEIWRLHPFDRMLTAWRRRDDGEYDVVQFTGGKVELHALPGITIDLDALFVSEG